MTAINNDYYVEIYFFRAKRRPAVDVIKTYAVATMNTSPLLVMLDVHPHTVYNIALVAHFLPTRKQNIAVIRAHQQNIHDWAWFTFLSTNFF